MKIRIKFAKTGVMKFVGHLDVMRYFQKAIRRAELPIAYSEGFSPHMLLSFASPLGVGISSTGEYFDMVLAEDMKTDEIVKRLNATMVEGMEVLSARHVPDGKASKVSRGRSRLSRAVPRGKNAGDRSGNESAGVFRTSAD